MCRWSCLGDLKTLFRSLASSKSNAKGSEAGQAEALAARCPSGFFKLDAAKLQGFLAAATASDPDAHVQGGSSAASRLALVVDYDLTVSHSSAKEGHHLIRDSPEVPAALRADLEEFWAAMEDPMHPSLQEHRGCDPGPPYPHLFWRGFNSIIVRHGLKAEVIRRAVASEGCPRIRPGFQEVLDLCEAHGIPIVVLSAGLDQVIHEALARDGIRLPGVCRVLSNVLVFDEGGRCVDVEPKDPPSSRQGKLHLLTHMTELADRSCVLLVGDKPVDAWVDKGLPPLVPRGARASRSLLRFGFMNAASPAEDILEQYVAAYDILPRDGASCSWSPIVGLLEAMLSR